MGKKCVLCFKYKFSTQSWINSCFFLPWIKKNLIHNEQKYSSIISFICIYHGLKEVLEPLPPIDVNHSFTREPLEICRWSPTRRWTGPIFIFFSCAALFVGHGKKGNYFIKLVNIGTLVDKHCFKQRLLKSSSYLFSQCHFFLCIASIFPRARSNSIFLLYMLGHWGQFLLVMLLIFAAFLGYWFVLCWEIQGITLKWTAGEAWSFMRPISGGKSVGIEDIFGI